MLFLLLQQTPRPWWRLSEGFCCSVSVSLYLWLFGGELVDLISKLDQGRSTTIFLNIALLFFVAIEPYLLNILSTSQDLFPFTSTLYAIDMSFLMGISAALCHILLKEKKETLAAHQLKFYTMNRNGQFVFAGLFLLSIVPQFAEWILAGFSVRVLIWFATLALSISVSARNRKKQAQNTGS